MPFSPQRRCGFWDSSLHLNVFPDSSSSRCHKALLVELPSLRAPLSSSFGSATSTTLPELELALANSISLVKTGIHFAVISAFLRQKEATSKVQEINSNLNSILKAKLFLWCTVGITDRKQDSEYC